MRAPPASLAGLLKGLSPESFRQKKRAGNPKIAGMLHRADYIENMVTGARKMQRLMSEAGLAPLEFTFGVFEIIKH
jgi:predicted HTH transcriptional regulator